MATTRLLLGITGRVLARQQVKIEAVGCRVRELKIPWARWMHLKPAPVCTASVIGDCVRSPLKRGFVAFDQDVSAFAVVAQDSNV